MLTAIAAKAHPSLFGALTAFPGAGSDKLSLEFGEAAEHRQHQPAMRRGGIGPRVPERAEAGAALGDVGKDVEQVASRTSQRCTERSSTDRHGGAIDLIQGREPGDEARCFFVALALDKVRGTANKGQPDLGTISERSIFDDKGFFPILPLCRRAASSRTVTNFDRR
jgi:hypothetical protein